MELQSWVPEGAIPPLGSLSLSLRIAARGTQLRGREGAQAPWEAAACRCGGPRSLLRSPRGQTALTGDLEAPGPSAASMTSLSPMPSGARGMVTGYRAYFTL